MRYAVIKLSYDRDVDEPEYILDIRTEILMIYHTLNGAYDFVDRWYDKTIEEKKKHFLEGDVTGQLKTIKYIQEKFDKGENKVTCSIIESGFLTKIVTKIYIQALDEVTQM